MPAKTRSGFVESKCPKCGVLYEALKNAVIAMGSMYRLQDYSEAEIVEALIPFKKALAKVEVK